MSACSAVVFAFIVNLEANLSIHIDPMYGSSGLNEREIERISIVGRNDRRLDLTPMLKEAFYQGSFILLIEDDERTFVFWLGCILKVFYVFANDFTICDEIALQLGVSMSFL